MTGELDEPVRRYLAHAVPGGAGAAPGVRLTMHGRIRVGAWLPFRAVEECDGRSFEWRASVGWGRLRLLMVTDRYGDGAGSTEGRLLGRATLFRADDLDTTRSAAGRAALEAVFAPAALLPARGVSWRAEDESAIVAAFDVPPERPELHLRIDAAGALRAVWAQRWGNVGQKSFGYIPCGCEVLAERRFGDLVVPSRLRVGWWFGTPRYRPFFTATVDALSH